jgi:hypothetical protein
MSDSRSALTERIAFAEEWLDRAKRDLADGNVTHGSLHVILAEAELQRAREVSVPPGATAGLARRRAAWWVPASRALMGTLVVAGVAATLLSQVSVIHEGAPAPDASWPVVELSGRTGEMLRLVTAPEQPPEPTIVERTIERTIVKPMIVRVAAPPRVVQVPAAAPLVPAPPAERPEVLPPVSLSQQQPASSAAPQSAAAESSPAAPVLSDADVIDLVLAAERSLRQPAKH